MKFYLGPLLLSLVACSQSGYRPLDLAGTPADLGADLNSAPADLGADLSGVPADLGADLSSVPDEPDFPPGLSLLAGEIGGPGNLDGIGAAARFDTPKDVAYDGAGNLYVVDAFNYTIRKIDLATAAVTTFAGSPGQRGSVDGIGSAARFRDPNLLVADGKGHLYVGEYNVIRKIDLATATVSTIAGTPGMDGSADGVGSAAGFDGLSGMVADPAGDLYISAGNDCTIRKLVAATATVSTIAGSTGKYGSNDGIGSAARFDSPAGLALDGAGNLYVADETTIRRIALATLAVTTFAGTPHYYAVEDGIGTAARFGLPQRLIWDGSGKLLIADNTNLVRSIDIASAAVTTIAGAGLGTNDGIGRAARFNGLLGLAVDGAGNLYIADTQNSAVRRMVLATAAVTTVAGYPRQSSGMDGAGSVARFSYPTSVVADRAGNIYVAENGISLIRKVVLATGAVTSINGSGGAPSVCYSSQALTLDRAGNLFIADCNSVRKLVLATGAVTTVASLGDGPYPKPEGIAADGAGNLYVAENRRHTISKIVIASGTVTTLAGGGQGESDGTGSSASFSYPGGLALDGAGNLYIADEGGATIRKLVLATGQVTTLAGRAFSGGASDGIGSSARFTRPTGLAFDGVDSLYVTDLRNPTVRKITLTDARVTTVVGTPGSSGIILGSLPGSLAAPYGICVTGRGALVITDETAGAILIAR